MNPFPFAPVPPCPVCKKEHSQGIAREIDQPFDYQCPDCLHVFSHQTALIAIVPRLHRAMFVASHLIDEKGIITRREQDSIDKLLIAYNNNLVEIRDKWIT